MIMGSNDKLLLRNIGIAATVVVGVIALFSIAGYSDEKSCGEFVDDYYENIAAVCPDEYLEWGYDSVEQCINDEMGKSPSPPPC